MSTSEGQLTKTAAEVYDEFFVPALFAEWAPRVADRLNAAPATRALDIACGTGVLARELARRLGPGAVTGLDCNEGMLAVARRGVEGAEFQRGFAEDLPFEAETFGAVASQFGLMFFSDRARALGEMWRVLAPGGRMAVAVWASLSESPGYAAMAELLRELFGPDIARELEAPFCLGNPGQLVELAQQAGVAGADVELDVEQLRGRARFPTLRDWVHTDIRGWTLADKINDEQYERLQAAAAERLAVFAADGRVEFDIPALVLTATKN